MEEKRWLGFTPKVWAWAVYDLANTLFTALFMSVNFPRLVVEFGGGTERLVGFATSAANLLAAAILPFIGAASDRLGRRKPFLFAATACACALTPAVAYLPRALMAVCGGLALASYFCGCAIYDAMLPEVAPPGERGRASGLGTAVGYLGAFAAMAFAWPIGKALGWDSLAGIRAMNWMTGAAFLAFSLPIFFSAEPRASVRALPMRKEFAAAWAAVAEGARRAPRELWIYVVASFCYVNGVMAVIVFFFLFAREKLRAPAEELVPIYAAVALAAGAGSALAGHLSDRFGPRRVLIGVGVAWIALLSLMPRAATQAGFLAAGIGGGAALGAVWTANRPMLVRLADPERMGETFGFLSLSSRSGSVIGPALFGVVATRYSHEAAIYTLIPFFIVGVALLRFVPDRRAAGGSPPQAQG